jgi:hypothetical protein
VNYYFLLVRILFFNFAVNKCRALIRLLENAFITLKKHDEIQIDTIFKFCFVFFPLVLVANGHAQQEFSSKTKMVPAKEKPVRPKVVDKPIPDPPKVQPHTLQILFRRTILKYQK